MPQQVKSRLLIIDDEQEWLDILSLVFTEEDWDVRCASSGEEGWAFFQSACFDFVLCDMSMPDLDGIELLKRIRATGDKTPFVIMTGVGTIRTAVEAVQFGAYNYITKPFRTEELEALALQALGHGRLNQTLQQDSFSRDEKEEKKDFPFVLGSSKMLQDILHTVSKVAASTASVLIQGETGTGKSLLARHIHDASPRRNTPLMIIDCGSLPENLMESELFGHVKGAFTGAMTTRKGLLEEAAGGTVFLDEIGELSPGMQIKLLHALQEKEIRPVGGNHTVPIDVRFLCATNRNLMAAVASGDFRKDLYYRLAVIPITLPPLRERKDDLIHFVAHFVRKYNETYGYSISQVSPAAMSLLMGQRWEGNVRELENIIERAVLLTDSDTITPASLGDLARGVPSPMTGEGKAEEEEPRAISLQQAVSYAERKAIALALTLSRGNRTEAAVMLGIGRRTLYHKLEEYGLELSPR